jgi:hypothetical protein
MYTINLILFIMKNSSYTSVPVIASIIGSKSRKAMFLTNITSLDGKRIYKDKWVPTSWNTNTQTEWRYTNKERGLINVIIHSGKYYKFNFKEAVLMTDKGAVNMHGAALDVDGLSKVVLSNKRKTIEWEHESQSLVEFPMSKATEAMIIETHDKRGGSTINSRLVDGVVKQYLQLEDRHIIYIPTWLMKNFEQRYSLRKVEVDELMTNDNDYQGVAERTAYDSITADTFSYIDRTEMNFETIDSLTQWELDNPEYAS